MVVQQVTIFVSSQFTPPGNPADPLTHFLSLSYSLSFLEESSNSQEFSVLKHPASASSQTHPAMMRPLLPGVSQSSLISSTSKPHPCEVLWSDKPALLWGGLIRGDALIRPALRTVVFPTAQFPTLTGKLCAAESYRRARMADESHATH